MRISAGRIFLITCAAVVFLGAAFMVTLGFFRNPRTFDFAAGLGFSPPEAQTNPVAQAVSAAQAVKNADIEPQKPLQNPPESIKAIYATGWSVGNPNRLAAFIKLIKETELNGIVIDLKDYSGYILYRTELDLPWEYDAVELRIPKINQTLKQLHDEGIYAIARISVFQDPRLALARPDLAMHSAKLLGAEYVASTEWKPDSENSTSGYGPVTQNYSRVSTIWKDRKDLAWIDPAAEEAWEYNASIAREALERGFDEINFDYIRFASDGNLADIKYPYWDGKTPKNDVMKRFFSYLRESLPGARISADLFGLVTVDQGDMGIGQRLEDAAPYFDYIAPMVYPSHYFTGFQGYSKPAEHPYEIVKYSIESAISRLMAYSKSQTATTTESLAISHLPFAKLRPWLQDFDLGADYDADMVKKQIQASYDAASGTPEILNGFMLWNPANVYTREALQDEGIGFSQ